MASFVAGGAPIREPYVILETAKKANTGGAIEKQSSFSVQIGGGDKALSIPDLAGVAAMGYTVSIPENIVSGPATGGKKEDAKASAILSVDEVSSMCSAAIAPGKQAALDVSLCRAAVAARIASLSFGRCQVRQEVLELMAEMLNVGTVPGFTSVDVAGMELVMALVGAKGVEMYSKSSTAAMVDSSACGLKHVSVTTGELKVLLSGQFLCTGPACLLAHGALNLTTAAECVSALSCEIIGVSTEAFQAENFEVARQHRGQIVSASNLMLMLEGSKRVNAAAPESNSSNFVSIPQIFGSAKDGLSNALKALDVELNSSELKASSSSMDPTPAVVNMNVISTVLRVLADAAASRVSILKKDAAPIVMPSSKSLQDFTGLFEVLGALESLVATEASLTCEFLDDLESKMSADGASKGKGGGEVDSEAAAKAAAAAAKAKEAEASWTPEQRAKAEAARKKKEEKAAAKKAAKDSKKGNGVVLGLGTRQLRDYLKSGGTMEIFNSKEGLSAFSTSLVETLNSAGKRKPKVAKGTRDYGPEQMRIREQVFSTIRRIFKRHGGVEIDTPVFELKEVLTGKYGEDTKLIYDLADQGGEILALRYDLTVPFARYLAMNSVGNIKRYHIAKVYRRDQPQLNRGRYREFYQCDFDIAGSYAPMVADAEAITIATEILTELPVGEFQVKINHRCLLDAIFEICGVPAEKFRPICSAVDKLDKAPWEEVCREMVEEKGLSLDVAEKIGKFVLNADKPMALWKRFTDEKTFGDHKVANEALASMKSLFDYLEAMGSIQHVSFDMSLARGLDYYTGVIYEMVIMDGTTRVGSIAAGGRYDNLVGMFSVSNTQTPCVGVSIGIERVFTIIEKKAIERKLMGQSDIQVFIASIGGNTLAHRMRVAKELWAVDVASEYSPKENPKLKPQMDECLERGIPFMVVFGEDEIAKGVVNLKNMEQRTEVEVKLEDLASKLVSEGCRQIVKSDAGFLDLLR